MTINSRRPGNLSKHLRRGVALIAVLSLLSLLTVLALGALNAARRHAALAHISFTQLQQREFADSALRLAILELTAAANKAESLRLGNRVYALFGHSVRVEVQREAGRIDLNFSDESLLTAAFAGNGFSEGDARSIAARIVDWRDGDDSSGEQGAERSEYRRADRTIVPRNGPFETVSELRLVLGAEQVAESLLDAFTVYSHRADVRQEAAPPAVLRALRWAHEQQLDGRTWLSDGAIVNASQEQDLAGEVLRLKACSTIDAAEVCRTTVLRLTGDWEYPALVFSWS